VANTKANRTYDIVFELTHGVKTSNGLANIKIVSDFFRTQKEMEVNCNAVDCRPMAVTAFNFIAALSAQTSRTPCSANTVVLQVTVNMAIWCDVSITLNNIQGTDGTPKYLPVYFISPGGVKRNGTWISESLSADLPASVRVPRWTDNTIFFNFTVANQKEPRVPSQPIFLQATFRNPGGGSESQQSIVHSDFDAYSGLLQPFTFENKGLVGIDKVVFTTSNISQGNPYPCAKNRVTITLVSNTAFTLQQISRCYPTITLEGLHRSLTPSGTMALQINKDGIFNESGNWYQAEGKLTLPFAGSAAINQTLVFAFDLINPSSAQPATKAQVRLWSSLQSMETSADYREMGGVYQHNTTYKENGEHYPLHVRALFFEVKHIGQSNPHSGCLNVISVTLQVNLPLSISAYCHPKIVIAALSNAEAPTGQILLNAASGQCAASANADMLFQPLAIGGVKGYGLWNDTADSMELWSANDMLPGQPYVFSFGITNPRTGPQTSLVKGQEAPEIRITSAPMTNYPTNTIMKAGIPSYSDLAQTTNEAAALIPSSSIMTQDEGSPCCLCDVKEGDARPLRVKVPVFCNKRIGQSTPLPCSQNTLTITLTSTAKLVANDSILTLSRMIGVLSEKQNQTVFQLDDGSFGQEHNKYFSSRFGSTPGSGNWSSSESKLRLFLLKDIECGLDIVVAFRILNPGDCTQTPLNMQIQADSVSGMGPIILPTDMFADVFSTPPGFSRGDAVPLRIQCLVMQGTIRQSSALPCDAGNMIHVALTLNRPLTLTCQPVITLTGLLGSKCLTGPTLNISQSQNFFKPEVAWNWASGTMILEPMQDLATFVNFSFTLKNPAQGQSANTNITIEVRGSNYLKGFKMFNNFRLNLPTGLQAEFYPLFVKNAKLTLAKIGQQSPFLCDLNAITLKINSNVTVKHCQTIITVGPFAGLTTLQGVSTLRGVGKNLSASQFSYAAPYLTVDLGPLIAAGHETEFVIRVCSRAFSLIPCLHSYGVCDANIHICTPIDCLSVFFLACRWISSTPPPGLPNPMPIVLDTRLGQMAVRT
jgi:hypothetical protein